MDGINALIATAGGYKPPDFDLQTAQKNALLIQGGELELKNKMRDWELRPMKDEVTALSYLTDIAPMVEYENYPMVREDILKKGINPNIIPDPSYFEQLAQQHGVPGKQIFDIWKNNAMTGLQRQALRIKTANEGWKPATKEEAIEVSQARGGTRKVGDIKTYQVGDKEATFEWDGTQWNKVAEGPKWNPKDEGFDISMDKEGNVRITKGAGGTGGGVGAGPSGMTKPTQTAIEKKLFDSTNALARLQRIEQSFKPEYLTWKTKLGQQITSWKTKAGIEISPEDKQMRMEFSTFQRRAMSNLNQYLNELSGAAITEQEAKRLTQAMPDPQKDDPIDFESKMRDVIEESKLSISRYNYLLANGWTEEQIVGSIKKNSIQSIGAFKSQIQARIKEIREEEKAAGTYEGDIPGIVKQKLRQEFKL